MVCTLTCSLKKKREIAQSAIMAQAPSLSSPRPPPSSLPSCPGNSPVSRYSFLPGKSLFPASPSTSAFAAFGGLPKAKGRPTIVQEMGAQFGVIFLGNIQTPRTALNNKEWAE